MGLLVELSFILDDFSEQALQDANQENMIGFYGVIARSTPGFEWIESGGMAMTVADVPISVFNAVCRTNLAPAEVSPKIKEIVDFYSTRNLPFQWMVGPRDTPSDLSKRLEEAGLQRGESTRMAIDLRQLKLPLEPSGFRLEKVKETQTLDVFSRLMPEAYGLTDTSQEAVTRWVRSIGLNENLRHYLGYLHGKAVATASVFFYEGVAGLYCVATLPEARGKGIGSFVSAAPLIEAREEGYRIAILQSSRMGYPVYVRLGFKESRKGISYSLKK